MVLRKRKSGSKEDVTEYVLKMLMLSKRPGVDQVNIVAKSLPSIYHLHYFKGIGRANLSPKVEVHSLLLPRKRRKTDPQLLLLESNPAKPARSER